MGKLGYSTINMIYEKKIKVFVSSLLIGLSCIVVWLLLVEFHNNRERLLLMIPLFCLGIGLFGIGVIGIIALTIGHFIKFRSKVNPTSQPKHGEDQ